MEAPIEKTGKIELDEADLESEALIRVHGRINLLRVMFRPRFVEVVLDWDQAEENRPGQIYFSVSPRHSEKPSFNAAARLGERQTAITFQVPYDAFEVADASDLRSYFFDLNAGLQPKVSRIAVAPQALPDQSEQAGRVIALFRTKHGMASMRSSLPTGLPMRVPEPKDADTAAKPLRIMIFVSQINLGGGKTKAMFKLAQQMTALGHHVCLTALYYGNNLSKHRWPRGVAFDFADGSYKTEGRSELQATSKLSHASKNVSLFAEDNLAHLLAISDYDVVYLPSYDGSLYKTFFKNVPRHTVTILGDHNPWRLDQLEPDDNLNGYFREAARRADAVHVVNPLLVERLKQAVQSEVFYIPNTAGAVAPTVRGTEYFKTRSLVAIGRLVKTKRMDHLIEAFARVAEAYPKWVLEIFGSGGLEAELEDRISSLRMNKRIFMRGFDPAVVDRLSTGCVYVTSTAAEALPLTMIEAMEAGCLMVSYDRHMGARYLIQEGVSGLLAKEADIESLSEALAKAMDMVQDRDPRVLSMIGEAAKRLPEFENDRVSGLWDQTLRRLVTEKRRAG